MHLERCIFDALVVVGGVFGGMDDEFVSTMATPVDRNYFFDRVI